MRSLYIDYSENHVSFRLNTHETFTNFKDDLSLYNIKIARIEELTFYIESSVFLLKKNHIERLINNNSLKYKLSNNFEEFLKILNNNEEVTQFSLEQIYKKLKKEGFERKLYPFQERNLLKLVNTNAFADFSVPGTGKTTVALAYFFFKKKKNDKLLVISPKTTFIAWEDELKECLPRQSINVLVLSGNYKAINNKLTNFDKIALMSYNKLASQTIAGLTITQICNRIKQDLSINIDTFIFLDESHKIKSGTGITSTTVAELRIAQMKPSCKLIMTGTPMPNNIKDLSPQFLFSDPSSQNEDIGTIYKKFQKRFVRTAKNELGLLEKRIQYVQVPMSKSQEKLWLSLKSITYSIYEENMDKDEALQIKIMGKIYQYLIWAVTNPMLLISKKLDIDSKYLSNKRFLELATELIKDGPSNKIREVVALAREIISKGRKVVIWSGSVDTIEELSEILDDVGSVFIHGGVDSDIDEDAPDTRKQKIKQFNDNKSCNVLIANPASCAEGISLHKACHDAIYLDRNYTLTNYLQSVDRIHRLGLASNQETNIYIFQSVISSNSNIKGNIYGRLEDIDAEIEETIDHNIDKRLILKEKAMEKFMNTKDLKELDGIDYEVEDDQLPLIEDIRSIYE